MPITLVPYRVIDEFDVGRELKRTNYVPTLNNDSLVGSMRGVMLFSS